MNMNLSGLCDDSCDDTVHMGATTVRATTLGGSCDDISHMEL